ncbi:hypothetical protein CMI39_01810 [Candidatus Pacearchaeota archaeon]|jgi:hypothetical protein|nr:hypothetical protein [Candidatus Pacearchaeota archaeon]|tara:strand:- start:9627 stop:10838 length:1212 start_codon:yes stop_codon:yes gene_type:complete
MRLIISLVILLLVFPIISSIEFDIKSEFKQGETLIAKVSGNFIKPILKENIFFYRGHVRTPIEYDVAKINNEFYIYALLPVTSNNYSISIEDVEYMEGRDVSDKDIVRNFSIKNETSDFSINPGFIIAKEDFSLEVQNLQDEKINIKSNINEDVTTLISGESKKIYFKSEDVEQNKLIELSSDNLVYEIPIYTLLNKTIDKNKNFKFDQSELNIQMSLSSEKTQIIYLSNTGKETLEDISLSVLDPLEQYVSLSAIEIDELKEDSSIKIELTISSDNEEKQIVGQITAKESSGNNTIYSYLTINLDFLKDYVPIDEEIQTTSQTCSEISGKICDSECTGETKYAKDGICCLGQCKEVKESSTGKIIGWIIVLLIIGFVYWFFKNKYRGTKKDINLLKIAKGKR